MKSSRRRLISALVVSPWARHDRKKVPPFDLQVSLMGYRQPQQVHIARSKMSSYLPTPLDPVVCRKRVRRRTVHALSRASCSKACRTPRPLLLVVVSCALSAFPHCAFAFARLHMRVLGGNYYSILPAGTKASTAGCPELGFSMLVRESMIAAKFLGLGMRVFGM
jgi:hypothetical protein